MLYPPAAHAFAHDFGLFHDAGKPARQMAQAHRQILQNPEGPVSPIFTRLL